MKKLSYDTSDFDGLDESNSFSKEIISAFLKELESLIPKLENILKNKNAKELYQAIHKVKPTIYILKIKHIFQEIDSIHSITEYVWSDELECNTINVLEHLKVVESEMKSIK